MIIRICLVFVSCTLILSCKSGFTAVNYRTDVEQSTFKNLAILPVDLAQQRQTAPGAAARMRSELATQLTGLGYTIRASETVDIGLKGSPISGKADIAGMRKAASVLHVQGFVFTQLTYETTTYDRKIREHLRIALVSPGGEEVWHITMVDERSFENAIAALKRQMQESRERMQK